MEDGDNMADPSDRATAEEAIASEEAMDAHRRRASAHQAHPLLKLCACGCGEEVDPRHLALGLGLTLECAQAMERRR